MALTRSIRGRGHNNADHCEELIEDVAGRERVEAVTQHPSECHIGHPGWQLQSALRKALCTAEFSARREP